MVVNINPKEMNKAYQEKKDIFHKYIGNIKRKSKWDIFNIINPTLVKNPYASEFPKRFFADCSKNKNSKLLFLKVILKYYLKSLYLFTSYFIAFVLYKIYYTKQKKNEIKIIIDTFGLVDKTNQNNTFNENYLNGIYEIFEKYDTDYAILLRPCGVSKNPFKLKQFFKIIDKDKREFIFEYELLTYKNFIELFVLIAQYPFKVLRVVQDEDNDIDRIFNDSLITDIKFFSFDGLTRYILGENLSKIDSIEKIYSWCEFQVIERSFNYAIRTNNNKIELIGLQFYLNYETYFNAYVDDLDYEMLSSPHKVLVNGKYYIQNREKVKYDVGISLRYKDIFNFQGIKKEKNILLLGSYIESDTKYMLRSVKEFDNVIFKNHPAVDILKFGKLPKNITVSTENIYKLFKSTRLLICSASGTAVEAVACRVPVLIIASQDNLTANPLVEYGQGRIWDISFSQDDIKILYTELMEYRKNNIEEIKEIASWYKDNFFVELTEENVVKTFEF